MIDAEHEFLHPPGDIDNNYQDFRGSLLGSCQRPAISDGTGAALIRISITHRVCAWPGRFRAIRSRAEADASDTSPTRTEDSRRAELQ